MVARGRGGGITPVRVVELLQDEVAKTSQAATARATGLTLQTVQRYIKGIGEPSQASLEKLSAYFGVTVAELRGGKNKSLWTLIDAFKRGEEKAEWTLIDEVITIILPATSFQSKHEMIDFLEKSKQKITIKGEGPHKR